MLIRKSAIREFLARPLRDCRVYKRMSTDQLEQCVERLPVWPPIWSKLRLVQQRCFVMGVELKRAYFMADTGCVAGETKIETDQGPKRIDELAKAEKSIQVYCL